MFINASPAPELTSEKSFLPVGALGYLPRNWVFRALLIRTLPIGGPQDLRIAGAGRVNRRIEADLERDLGLMTRSSRS